MRFEGVVKSWNDERGFGFIEPTPGGQDVFVHIKAFPARSGRPQVGWEVSFEVELNREGKQRAKNVELMGVARSESRREASPARQGNTGLLAIPAFLLIYVTVMLVWSVPRWVAAVYVGASLVSMFIYAFDKSAAGAGGRRVSESTLLFVGLVGGWPGSLVAQHLLRHKTSKASFRSEFWVTVFVNVIAFVALNSPFVLALFT